MDHLNYEYDYLKAHHDEFLRSTAVPQRNRQHSTRLPRLWVLFTNLLGDVLIALGMRVKYGCWYCAEAS